MITGTRIGVSVILGRLAHGELLDDYPQLTAADLDAVIMWRAFGGQP